VHCLPPPYNTIATRTATKDMLHMGGQLAAQHTQCTTMRAAGGRTVDLRRMAATLDANADVDVGESLSAQEMNGLLDLREPQHDESASRQPALCGCGGKGSWLGGYACWERGTGISGRIMAVIQPVYEGAKGDAVRSIYQLASDTNGRWQTHQLSADETGRR